MKFSLPTPFALLAALFFLPATGQAQSVIDLTVGETHYCSLDDAGAVSCTTTPETTRLLPPPGLPAFTELAAGIEHTCGLTVDGNAVCWGRNFFGQLDVPPLSAPLVSLSAGYNHTCGVDTNGDAICWGLNSNAQLDPPETDNGFIQVDGTRNYSCGILTDGGYVCWSTDGEVNAGVITPGPFVDVDLTSSNRCGLLANGDIECIRLPFNAPTNGPYMDLAVTGGVVCGLTLDGELDCNISSFLGDEVIEEINTISETVRFTAIESGQTFLFNSGNSPFVPRAPLCGIRADDSSVLCFGSPDLPQTANNAAGASDLSGVNLNLIAVAYDTNAVELFWNRQPVQSPQLMFEIFRDDELLTTTDAMFSFFDTQSVPETESTYRIRAVNSAGATSPFSNDITVSRETLGLVDPSGNGVNPREDNGLRIENLNLTAVGFGNTNPQASQTGTVLLTWDPLNNSPVPVAGYEIRQNNEVLAFTTINVYSNISINTNFCGTFSVLAIGDGGQIIETASAPLVTAGQTCP